MFNESGQPGALDESAEMLVARLRKEIAERDDLLSLTAHELRNPLHALSLQLALARSTARSHAQPDTVARIAKAQATLGRYIDRLSVLLDLARLNTRAYPLCRKPLDLSVVLAALAEALDSEARFHGVHLITDLPPSLPALSDALVVEQIVENLLRNAFKHAACSTVTLRLSAAADGWAQIEVADDGTGLRAEDQERVFGKFETADDAQRGDGSAEGSIGRAGPPSGPLAEPLGSERGGVPSALGSGLGLWIVRKLLDAMGGGVTLESFPGAGCVFTVRFPLLDRHEPIA